MWTFWKAAPASYESDNIRIVHFEEQLTIGINGRTGLGIVVKPNNNK